MVIEPNAVAQEAGLSAVLEYVSNAPNASRYIKTLVKYKIIKTFSLLLVLVKRLFLLL